MYRQYEDPRALEKRLKELKEEYKVLSEQSADEDTLVSMAMDIEELEERVNFAWQDEEHDERDAQNDRDEPGGQCRGEDTK